MARIPTRGSPDAAGYDLYSAEEKVVPARGKMLINTQISIAPPPGTYGRIAPRSRLAAKNMITTGAGVVDADYRGGGICAAIQPFGRGLQGKTRGSNRTVNPRKNSHAND